MLILIFNVIILNFWLIRCFWWNVKLALATLSHYNKDRNYFFDARFGFRLTVLTITEDASLSSAKLISFSSFSEGIFVPSFSTKFLLLHVYNTCGASSQDGEELLLSIVAAPSCCLSVPSRSNVVYSDSNICLA